MSHRLTTALTCRESTHLVNCHYYTPLVYTAPEHNACVSSGNYSDCCWCSLYWTLDDTKVHSTFIAFWPLNIPCTNEYWIIMGPLLSQAPFARSLCCLLVLYATQLFFTAHSVAFFWALNCCCRLPVRDNYSTAVWVYGKSASLILCHVILLLLPCCFLLPVI